MKKTLLFLLAVSFLPVLVRAQIPSLNVTIEPDGHGGWREVVENQAFSSVVAMRTTFQRRTETKIGSTNVNTKIVVAYDSITNYGTVRHIPSGGVGYLFAQDPSKWSGGVDAVIFSDGHSEGDPQGVLEIYERRRGDYRAVTEVLPLLDTIANQGASPTQVADAIHHLYQSLPNDRTISAGERRGRAQVYSGLEDLLRSQTDIVGLYDPAKYPPQRSIDQVAKVKGISREQAHAIVIGEKYRRLEAFLGDNLQPLVAK
jgi:hypothetical protein